MAANEAGISEDRKNEIVEQATAAVVQMADAKEEITTVEIRDKILGDLDQIEPSVSKAWRIYDQERIGA